MISIGSIIGFQMLILLLVGTNILDFRDYDWLLPALLIQNLVQIVGLAVYAVRSLFSDITIKNGEKSRHHDSLE